MPMVLLEVCVDTADNLHAAVANGAARIELCAALDGGGITPSYGFMRLAAAVGIPVHALVRPRNGDFTYGQAELRVMVAHIEAARAAGLAGVVLGASRPDGTLDTAALRELVRAANGLSVTLHRCIDLTPDPMSALEEAVALGLHRILSSGGAPAAPDGAETLAALVRAAAGRIVVMPGGGVTPANAASLLARTGAQELHASCRAPAVSAPAGIAALGFPPARAMNPACVRVLSGLTTSERFDL